MPRLFLRNNGRFFLSAGAKLALAVGLIAGMIHYGPLDFKLLEPLKEVPHLLLTAFALLVIMPFIGAFRWKNLLDAQGVHLQYSRLVQINLIGVFFNAFLIGGVGGDAARLLYIIREAPANKERSVAALLIDRYLGLFGLSSVVVAAIAFNIVFLDWEVGQVWLVGGVLALFFAMLSILLAGIWFSGAVLATNVFRKIEGFNPIVRHLFEIVCALSEYRYRIRSVVIGWILTLVIHSLAILSVIIIAQVLRIGDLTAGQYAIVTPLSILTNAIPLTPGGIGIGEAAFYQFSRVLSGNEIPAYATIYLVFRLLLLTLAICCVPVYASYRKLS